MNVWEEHADILVRAMVGDQDTFQRVAYELSLEPEDLPAGVHRKSYQAILSLPAGIVPEPENIRAIYPDFSFVSAPQPKAQIDVSVAVCKDQRQRANLSRVIDKAQSLLKSNEDTTKIIDMVSSSMILSTSERMKPSKLRDIHERMKIKGAEPKTRTNIQWFDALTKGGFRNKYLFAIGGVEKSRKSSLIRNLLMYMFRQRQGKLLIPRTDMAGCVLAFENDQFITYADYAASLAAEYVYYTHGLAKTVVTPGGPVPLMSFMTAELVENYISDPDKVNNPLIRTAFDYGLSAADALEIEVMDRNRDQGALTNIDSVVKHTNRMLATYPDKQVVMVVDYLQLVRNEGASEYDSQFMLLNKVLDLMNQGNGCIFIMAAQKSLASRRSDAKKEDNKDIGTRGGTALQDACHHYFTTDYNPDEAPDILRITNRASRRSQQGKNVYVDFRIEPNSGLFLGTQGVDIL